MVRRFATRASTTCRAFVASLAVILPAATAAAADYACNFVEVQCDRAANLVRIVPFRAENEECERLRAVKDADWLVDVARHVRATGKERTGSGGAKIVKCELGEGKSVTASIQGTPVDAKLRGRCGEVFSAIVTIDELQPHPRRVVNELNLLQHCEAGGAADRIEYFPDSQKLLIQWSSEPQFGVLERTVLARQNLKAAARNGR
jgi:hypothetical protein